MAEWKKVIVSGSQAELAALTASIAVKIGTNQQITTSQSTTFLTGSFTGSFTGDGSGLTGVPAIFPVTQLTNLATSTQIYVNDGANKYISYSDLVTDLAGAGAGTSNLTTGDAGDSLALTSQIAVTGVTASLLGTASFAISSSAAATTGIASIVNGVGPYYVTFVAGNAGNLQQTVDPAGLSYNATTNVLTTTASFAIAASTASYINTLNQDVIITGSLAVTSNITSSGLLVTGSTAGNLVRITQTGAGAAFVVEDSANPDANAFVIDNTGKVFIGATSASGTFNSMSPAPKLDVSGSVVIAGKIQIGNITDPSNEYQLYSGLGPIYARQGDPLIGDAAIVGVASNSSDIGPTLGTYIGVNGAATAGDDDDPASTYIGGKFYAGGDYPDYNYAVQLQDGSQGIGKVLVSQTADGKARWSTSLSGSYEITGSLKVTAGITGSLQGTASFATSAPYSGLTGTPSGIVSGSVLSAGSVQGSLILTTNGVSSGDITALTLGTSSTPTFVGLTLTGDAAVNGGDITTTQTTATVFNTTATTVNAFGAATTLSLGAVTGTTTVNNNLNILGDLYVQGTTTTINTANLYVEDQFILLASGSAGDIDGGIIIDRGTFAAGNIAFGYDAATDRWGFQDGLIDSTNALDTTAGGGVSGSFMSYVFTEASHTATKPITGEFVKEGAIYTNTDGTIWMYA